MSTFFGLLQKYQKEKIKSILSANGKIFVKRKKLFEKIKIIDVRKKYFAESTN